MESTHGRRATQPVLSADEIAAALETAELVPLLLAVVSTRQDPRLLDPIFRPELVIPAAGLPVQGNLPPATLARLRGLLAEQLAALTEEDLDRQPLPDDLLLTVLDFMTGGRDEGYLPIMRRELNWTEDVSRPPADLGERFAGRRVAIVGGGVSGVALAVRLSQAGVDYVLFEKNDRLGGTWYENRYPGCRLDTSNLGYAFSFEQTTWKHYFSTQPEVHDYIEQVAERHDVLPHVRFGQEVSSMSWDGRKWNLQVDGALEKFDFAVSAVGQLNRPRVPVIPGAGDFAGLSWHSATWPENVDLAGQRVSMVGTGASGFQIGPAIADEVESLAIFQRNAPWMFPTPAYTLEFDPHHRMLLDRFPAYLRWLRFYQFWLSMDGRLHLTQVDPEWKGEGSVSAPNAEFRAAMEEALVTQFGDRPDLLAHVVPSYPPGGKRLLRDDGSWARTLKRDDVDLVTEGIDHIEADAIVTTGGRRVPTDVIVYATGFQVDRFLTPMHVVGVDGRVLAEQWGDRAETYMGMSVDGFPNFAMLFGPNSNLVVNGSALFVIESAVERIVRMIEFLADEDIVSIDVPRELVREFVEECDRANEQTAWGSSGIDNFYKGASGRVVAVWPFTMRRYWEQASRDDFADWNVETGLKEESWS